jgi:putative SbcD/Mre11-related phosphoesterase
MITPLLPYPAAIVKTQKTRTLAITDLHIGWELALLQKGIHVPTQTSKLLNNLKALVSKYKPESLLILGDVKHTVATAEMSEWRDVPDFFNELRKKVTKIDILRGNHDGNLNALLPENVTLLPATGTTLGDVGFFHGHQWPSPALLGCKTLVMGHVHPVIAFRDLAGFRMARQVWVKATCDGSLLARVLLRKYNVKIEKSPEETLRMHFNTKPKTEQLFIMPSFNEFLGGRPLNESWMTRTGKAETVVGPVLRSEAVDFDGAETYLLDGTFLGTIGQLKTPS